MSPQSTVPVEPLSAFLTAHVERLKDLGRYMLNHNAETSDYAEIGRLVAEAINDYPEIRRRIPALDAARASRPVTATAREWAKNVVRGVPAVYIRNTDAVPTFKRRADACIDRAAVLLALEHAAPSEAVGEPTVKLCHRRAGDGEECGLPYGHKPPHHPRARVYDRRPGDGLRDAINVACVLINPRISEVDWDAVAIEYGSPVREDEPTGIDVERLKQALDREWTERVVFGGWPDDDTADPFALRAPRIAAEYDRLTRGEPTNG